MISSNCLCKEAILVYPILSKLEDTDWYVQEFLSLAYSANIKIISTVFSNCKIIHSKYFIRIGKLLELQSIVQNKSISIILFSCSLSSGQEYNLSCFLKCKIIDRNQLILNIFGKRARTYEGKLQVKLARLRYLNSRLTHEWNHLERQTGGIGVRGGPGEMQLESDRRLLSNRMLQILSDLKKIENQRAQNRNRRIKTGIPSISLVGYTNAGKSTLFNVLTSSDVHTSRKLFVTLDPTFRYIVSSNQAKIMLIDTVGFMQNLPKDLLSSFKSTLEETVQSMLLLHVVDVSNKKFKKNMNTVHHILNDIHANNIPMLIVMNKIDQDITVAPHIDIDHNGLPMRVWISAQENLGIDLLKKAIEILLPNKMVRYELKIPINSSLFRQFFQLRAIEEYHIEDNNTIKIKICLSSVSWNRLLKYDQFLSSYMI